MHQSIPFFFAFMLLTSCSDNHLIDQPPISTCDDQVSIDEQRYQDDSSSLFNLISLNIEGDCMKVSFSASGCNSNSWKMDLVASDAIAESLPEQRYLKLSLENLEACLAVFTRDISFDLSSLQIQNDGALILNLEGFEGNLTYEY